MAISAAWKLPEKKGKGDLGIIYMFVIKFSTRASAFPFRCLEIPTIFVAQTDERPSCLIIDE